MRLINNVWATLSRSWALYAAYVGLLAPELLQFLADNAAGMPHFDEGTKASIRFWALALVIVLRVVKQPAVSRTKEPVNDGLE